MKLTVKLPNFSMTRGKIPDVSGGGNSGKRLKLRKRLKAIAGWGALGVFFFVTFAWLSLPTRAIAWRIEHEAKKAGIVLEIEDVAIRPWGTVILENVAWTYTPSRPGQIPGKFFVEEVDVGISLLSLIAGNISVDVDVELDEGSIHAEYEKGGDDSRYSFEIEDVPLYGLPKAQQSLNAPLVGIFALKGEIDLPEHKFEKSTGYLEITCAACRVGDGETKLFVPGSKGALANGVTIPEIDMGTLTGRMTIEDGVAKTDGPIETDSEDVWIHIEGELELNDPFAKSRFDMLLKFNLSETLQDRSEPMKLMIQTASDQSKLDAPESGLGFNLRGPVSAPRFYGHKTKSRRERRAEKRESYQKRAEERRKRSSARKSSTKKEDPKDAKDTRDTKDPKAPDPKDSPAGEDPPDSGLNVEPIKPALPPPAVDEGDDGGEAPGDDGGEEPAAAEEGGEEPAAADEGGDGEEVVIEDEGGEEQPADEGGEEPAGDDGQGDGQGDDGGGEGGDPDNEPEQ